MEAALTGGGLLLRWDGMKWEPKKAMKSQPMSILRSRNLPASAVESVKVDILIKDLYCNIVMM